MQAIMNRRLHIFPLLLNSFTVHSSPTYGNCYTFNSKLDAKEKKPVQYLGQTGPLLGLTLVVSLDQMFYMNGGQTQQAGARLVIHQNTQSTHTYKFFHSKSQLFRFY